MQERQFSSPAASFENSISRAVFAIIAAHFGTSIRLEMSKVQNVAVVGAGLGGLCAAIALRQSGFDVTVYEQAPELGEIGAGIQISPNASRVLIALGLDKAFEAIAFEPNRHVVRNWKSGSIVSATQMKGVFRPQYGAGYFGAHRADLHAVLQRAVPASAIRLNAKCISVTQSAERAVILFADGSQAEADAVIGADDRSEEHTSELQSPYV